MARKQTSAPKSEPIPELNRLGSIQAHHALMQRARKQGIDFGGHPTGVLQKGWKLFLYEDIGVGCVIPRIVRAVKPLDAHEYTPRLATAA